MILRDNDAAVPQRSAVYVCPRWPMAPSAPAGRSRSASCRSSTPIPISRSPRRGAEEAAKEIGGKVVQQAPSQATAEAQIEFINNLVAQKVDVIAIAGNDANAVAPALKRAAAQGVRVISYDSDVAPDARAVFINQAKGDSLAEMMLESMGEHDRREASSPSSRRRRRRPTRTPGSTS